MSEPLVTSIARSAAKLVDLGQHRGGSAALDFSRASLDVVEEMAAEAAQWRASLPQDHLTNLVQNMGCYVLEIGRREFGGDYLWHDDRDQPVLVVGEPTFHIGLLTWDKVRGRLGGDEADNLPFFYAGFAERVQKAVAGDRALYV